MKSLFLGLSLSLTLATLNLTLAGTAQGASDCGGKSVKDDMCTARIDDLHPTQMAVGLIEVRLKEKELRKIVGDSDALKKFEKKNPEPAVVGPGAKLYIIDHHHLARAMSDVGIKTTYCTIVANYSDLDRAAFWAKMARKSWVYPYDENGRGPRPFADLPQAVNKMTDDPYRSLAGEVRAAGGYEKSETPFTEFIWAGFFRTRISAKEVNSDFDQAVKDGVSLAHTHEARDLPGYTKD